MAAPTLHASIREARRRLERAGIEPAEAAIDADLLARHALGGWDRGRLLAAMRDDVPPGFEDAYRPLVDRRERREPAAYITGVREFWGLDVVVRPGVLIPRPETELIVEEVLGRLEPGRAAAPMRVADVGTGSGCLAVALARALPGAHVTAIDLSDAALAVAGENVVACGVADRVTLVKGDLLAAQPGPFDVIVSNPPYVPAREIPMLQTEVRDFEPVSALDGGPDGLDLVRRLAGEASSRLAPGGWFVFEFGCGQADGVRAGVGLNPALDLVSIRPDLAGIPRVAVVRSRRRTT
jgi:release factor glutamine methyltransferase